MPYMYSEMQNKLSKTRESPLESIGQIISSRCPPVFFFLPSNNRNFVVTDRRSFLYLWMLRIGYVTVVLLWHSFKVFDVTFLK